MRGRSRAALAAALAACSSPAALSDRDWQPRVVPSDCEVRIQHHDPDGRPDHETVQYHDAQGRLISGTAELAPEGDAWERFDYDARGRLVAITSYEQRPPIDGNCDVVGGCVTPAVRAIDRVELAWDDTGQLLRKVHRRDEYEEGRRGSYHHAQTTTHEAEYGPDRAERVAPRRARGRSHAYHRDERGRAVRRDTLGGGELEHYEVWEYDDRGAVTRYVDTWEHARGGIRQDRELLLRYDAAGRLREVRDNGQPQRIYTYAGACDAVRLDPTTPDPEGRAHCLSSPHRVLNPCWW